MFTSFPRLRLSQGDFALYESYRIREAALVSGLDDGDSAPEVLGLFGWDRSLGVISMFTTTNSMRASKAKLYTRIDLVITDASFRKMGVGRVLILCGILQALKAHRERLYSISCLAAHRAVEIVLEKLGFQGTRREEQAFTHMELKIDPAEVVPLTDKFLEELQDALKTLNYRIYQSL